MGEFTDALRRAGREEAEGGSADAAERPDVGPSEEIWDGELIAPLEDLAPHLPEPTRAEIPRSKDAPWKMRAVLVEDTAPVAEPFRLFALQLKPELERLRRSSVVIASALSGEGKSLTASNLALALASVSAGRRVALVDLDLHRPSIARGMGVSTGVGIERVLAGSAPLAAARIPTDVPSLDLYTVEAPHRRAHELLAGGTLASTLRALEERYDKVVIDTPPMLPLPDVELILPHAGGCVAIARSRVTLRTAFRQMIACIPAEKLIGCFLNDARLARHLRKYGKYSYEIQENADREG